MFGSIRSCSSAFPGARSAPRSHLHRWPVLLDWINKSKAKLYGTCVCQMMMIIIIIVMVIMVMMNDNTKGDACEIKLVIYFGIVTIEKCSLLVQLLSLGSCYLLKKRCLNQYTKRARSRQSRNKQNNCLLHYGKSNTICNETQSPIHPTVVSKMTTGELAEKYYCQNSRSTCNQLSLKKGCTLFKVKFRENGRENKHWNEPN